MPSRRGAKPGEPEPEGSKPDPKKPDPKKWPSVEAQLREAQVVHGSELEKLIRANQDTSLLRPGESDDDGIDVPLWLRVHYRKNHPDVPPAPAGPVGDYPEVLENLHEWLKSHQDMGKG
jgi:hypothetical protein